MCGWTDEHTDKAAAICSPFREHNKILLILSSLKNNSAMMALNHSSGLTLFKTG